METRMPVSLVLVLLASVLFRRGVSQPATTCGQVVIPTSVVVSETDLPGLQLFEQPAERTLNLTFDIDSPAGLRTELLSYFRLDWQNERYTMNLSKTLDLETLFKVDPSPFSVINIRIKCSFSGQNPTWDLFLTVSDVNEFTPYFKKPLYELKINEESSYGTSVLQLQDEAMDDDVNPASINGNDIDRFMLEVFNQSSRENGTKFNLTSVQTGLIQVIDRLNFEDIADNPYYFLNATVVDKGGLSNHTVIQIEVVDIDDQPPEFYTPNCTRPCFVSYQAFIASNHTGPLPNVVPAPIAARDGDTLNASIDFSIVPGSDPGGYFFMDPQTGVVSTTKSMDNLQDTEFILMVQAVEQTPDSRYTQTILRVRILPDRDAASSSTAPPSQTSTPSTGASLQAGGGDNNVIVIVLIVLAVLVLLLVVGFIISIVCVRKRYKRAISPETPSSTSEPATSEDEVSLGNKEQWPPYSLPSARESQEIAYPAMKDSSTATEPQPGRKRSRRRNRQKDPELFDGTREYEDSLDPDFFLQGDKSKVKQSMRSRDLNTDPKYWITVTDDY